MIDFGNNGTRAFRRFILLIFIDEFNRYSILFPERTHLSLIYLIFLECSGRACESTGGDRVGAVVSFFRVAEAILSHNSLELLVKK